MVGRSVWLEGGGGGNFGGAQKFSPRLIKTKSPQIEEKMGEKIVQKVLDKNAHVKAHCVRAAAHCFLFFFLKKISNSLCTCCYPLFPILKKKNKNSNWTWPSLCF